MSEAMRIRSRMHTTGFVARWRENIERLLSRDALVPGVQHAILAFILLATLAVRIWTLPGLPIDRTAWKEIDYIAISTNYWQHGYHFLWPEVSWPAEPPRVTELELPLVPYLTALAYGVWGQSVYTVRLVPMLAALAVVLYTFLLARRELGPVVGLAAATAAALIGLYHPWGRLLHTEPLLIATSLVAVYHWAQWVDARRTRDWWLAMAGLSVSISLKLPALYMLLPLLWIAFRRYHWRLASYRPFMVLVLFALVLPGAWYAHAYSLERIGVHQFGIFRGHDKMQSLTLLADPAWYRLMFVRVAGQVLGGEVGLSLFLVGLGVALWLRQGDAFLAYLVAVGTFFAIVAEGNRDGSYHQITALPPLAGLVGLGAAASVAALATLADRVRRIEWRRSTALAVCLLACGLLLLGHPIRRRHVVFQWMDDPALAWHEDRWAFAEATRQYLGSEAKLVAVGEYSVHARGNDISPVLFHYLDVQGWILQPNDWSLDAVARLVVKGATHLAILPTYGEPESGPWLQDERGAPFVAALKARYATLYEGERTLLLDLRTPIATKGASRG